MARHDPWSLWFDGVGLTLDAAAVIGMRLGRLAAMDAVAMAEAQRMIAEKVMAAAAIQAKAMTGQLGRSPAVQAQRTLSHYRREVGKNRRRLARNPKR